MATITPTNLRTKQQDSAFYLSIFQPVTLLAASVDNGSIARGARTVQYDGGSGSGFATIEAFQLVEVDTATGTQLVRLKSITGNQSAGSIEIDENDINFADNQTIRVKHFYPLVAIPPSIRSQIFYKFFDLTYSNQNSLVNPVAIIGSHRVGVLSAGSVAFALNSSSSYAIAQGATIASRVWSCVHNGGGTTGVSFSSTVAANPTLTITVADQYWLKCVVTDSNGKTQTTYRAIFVYADVKDAYKDFTVSTLTGDWMQSGWQFGVTATGDVTLSDFPDGTLAVLWYVNKFDGVAGYIDLWGTASQQIVCAGYLRRDQDVDDFSNGTGRVSFSVTTPDSLMDNMSEMGSISLNAVASPSKWYQYASWLTIGRGIHHLLKWHSSVLETVDVLGLTDNVLGVKTVDFTEPTILQMVNSLGYGRGHFAKIVSNRQGRLYFTTDSQMLNDAGRAALDTVFSITTADISGAVDVVRQPEASAAMSDLDGFSFNGTTSTPFISVIPGYRESAISYGLPGYRGGGAISTKGQVLASQTDSNEKAGRVFAAANNNPQELRFTTPANYLGAFDIVPSVGWYQWGISDNALKRQVSLNNRLFICRNVSHQINHQAGTIQTSVAIEPEAEGPNGVAGNYPVGYPVSADSPGPVRSPSWDDSGAGTNSRLLITGFASSDDDGYLMAGSVGPLTIGTPYAYSAGTIFNGKVCGLETGKAVVVFDDNGDGKIKAAVVTISGITITSVAAAQDIATAITLYDAVALSSTSVIVTYDDHVVTLSISGTTITVNTPTLLSIIGVTKRLTRLTNTTALLYANNISSNTAILTVSGVTTTEGTYYANPSFTSDVVAIVAIDSTTCIYISPEFGSVWRATLLTNIAGDSITYADEIEVYNSSPVLNVVGICRLSSTKVLVVYSTSSTSFSAKVITYDGASSISDGVGTVVSSGTNDRYNAAPIQVRSGLVSVAYIYQIDGGGTFIGAVRSLSVSGTTVTNNNDEIEVRTYAATGQNYISQTITETPS